jgi:hypothetical protein
MSILSLPWKLLSAPFKGSWRRKVLAGVVIAGILATATVLYVTRNAPSQTTYSSQDGSYKVTVTHFPDGSKQETREGNTPKGSP